MSLTCGWNHEMSLTCGRLIADLWLEFFSHGSATGLKYGEHVADRWLRCDWRQVENMWWNVAHMWLTCCWHVTWHVTDMWLTFYSLRLHIPGPHITQLESPRKCRIVISYCGLLEIFDLLGPPIPGHRAKFGPKKWWLVNHDFLDWTQSTFYLLGPHIPGPSLALVELRPSGLLLRAQSRKCRLIDH
jgi:hypothetical protein